MKHLIIALMLLALPLGACSELKHSADMTQPTDTRLVAGIGDDMIEIAKKESLPNVFGKADLFGRTRPIGMVVVTYHGIEQDRAVLQRQTVRLQSNATTMNSSPIIIPRSSTTSYSGSTTFGGIAPSGNFAGSAMSSGTATTSAPPIALPPSGSVTQVIANGVVRVYLDLSEERSLIVEGREIVIEEATPSKVVYRINDLDTTSP